MLRFWLVYNADVGDAGMGIGSDAGCRGCGGDWLGGGEHGSAIDAANGGDGDKHREVGEMIEEGVIVCDSSSSISCT